MFEPHQQNTLFVILYRGDRSNEERGDMAAQVDITSAETPGEEQDCIESNTTPKHEAVAEYVDTLLSCFL